MSNYRKITTIIALIFSAILGSCCSAEKPATVKNFNPQKYMGTWFEIARLQTSFQKGKFNSKAEYTLLDDNRIKILNSAENSKGESTSAKAIAYAPDKTDFSKLRVSFFWPFYSDYLVLYVDKDYTTALVGGAGKRYLWILSRTQNIDEIKLKEILQLAKSLGYDTSKLLFNSELNRQLNTN